MTRRAIEFLVLIIAFAATFTAGVFFGLSAPPPLDRIYLWMTRQIDPQSHGANMHYGIRSHIFEQSVSQPITMLGDSLTELGDWTTLLQRTDIANQGISGDVTWGVLKRLNQPLRQSKIIFVLIGINDQPNYIRINDTKSNIRKIVEALSPASKVYLQSLILTRDDELNTFVNDVNGFEKQLCETGVCSFVDLNAHLAENGKLRADFAADDVHLTPAGYGAWAKAILPLLPK